MQKMDGMNYAPRSAKQAERVVRAGEFRFAVIGLDHGHIYAMTNGLLEAGAELAWVYDEDPGKVDVFLRSYPQACVAPSTAHILTDETIAMVASAIKPSHRCELGLAVLESGKHYFCDKPGMLSIPEAEKVAETCERTGKRYFIYFGERIHVEGALYAQKLIEEGALGEVISVTILAPHRLNKDSRPSWFFKPEENGGILVDIGSHQLEQFLTYTNSRSAKVLHSSIANYHNPDHPEFQDYGQCVLVGETGATCYFRVDWFTPDGMGAWGDGRMFIVGTKASVEIRKYLDVAGSRQGDHVYFVDAQGEHHIQAYGKLGFPFFGAMILDCIQGTEHAITQRHTLLAMELAITAQQNATNLTVANRMP
ncbi:MAG: Gfo/Idh/MocA family oxidoreductase [Spirochaetales bacterium]|nr:Gfo/Idh/MocA family oxidoreductase [Spirochaetales bacterium]